MLRRRRLSGTKCVARPAILVCLWALTAACSGGGAPGAVFPSAESALERLHEQQSCSVGVRAEATLDTLDPERRVRVQTLLLTEYPASVRFDVISPFGSPLATLTSDGERFTLLDVENNTFVEGPAKQCAVSEFLQVPIPPKVLAQLLSGDAPVLKHGSGSTSIAWQDGEYQVTVLGNHQARQTLHLRVHPDDYGKPTVSQRLRLHKVRVTQAGVELYRAELSNHQRRTTAVPWQDPDGIEPDVPPSGPACDAELPAEVEFVVQVAERDVILDFDSVEHNPPLLDRVFSQSRPRGAQLRQLNCR